MELQTAISVTFIFSSVSVIHFLNLTLYWVMTVYFCNIDK